MAQTNVQPRTGRKRAEISIPINFKTVKSSNRFVGDSGDASDRAGEVLNGLR